MTLPPADRRLPNLGRATRAHREQGAAAGPRVSGPQLARPLPSDATYPAGTVRPGDSRSRVVSLAVVHLIREAEREPEGALILNHGRGTDERDLYGLLDDLDPDRRLVGITPGAPLTGIPPGGRHWYLVQRVGYPDPETFAGAYRELTSFLDELLIGARDRLGPDRDRWLLDGGGDELCRRAGAGPPVAGGDRRAERIHSNGRGLAHRARAEVRPRGRDTPRAKRPGDRGRVRPAGTRAPRRGRTGGRLRGVRGRPLAAGGGHRELRAFVAAALDRPEATPGALADPR